MVVTWKGYGMKQFLSIGGISELIWEYINKESKLNIFYCELPKCISTEKRFIYIKRRNLHMCPINTVVTHHIMQQ